MGRELRNNDLDKVYRVVRKSENDGRVKRVIGPFATKSAAKSRATVYNKDWETDSYVVQETEAVWKDVED